jgi:hypothetical protein
MTDSLETNTHASTLFDDQDLLGGAELFPQDPSVVSEELTAGPQAEIQCIVLVDFSDYPEKDRSTNQKLTQRFQERHSVKWTVHQLHHALEAKYASIIRPAKLGSIFLQFPTSQGTMPLISNSDLQLAMAVNPTDPRFLKPSYELFLNAIPPKSSASPKKASKPSELGHRLTSPTTYVTNALAIVDKAGQAVFELLENLEQGGQGKCRLCSTVIKAVAFNVQTLRAHCFHQHKALMPTDFQIALGRKRARDSHEG